MVLCANGDTPGGGSGLHSPAYNACKEETRQECVSQNCSGNSSAACQGSCLQKALQECQKLLK